MHALGGSVAATLSVLAFYPLEVLRVHLQTQTAPGGDEANASDATGLTGLQLPSRDEWRRVLSAWRAVVFNKASALRLVHTQLTSFLFYGLYRQIAKSYFSKNKGAWANIVSSTSAAMLTVLLVGTPLDGIILRLQAPPQSSRAAEGEEARASASSLAERCRTVGATATYSRARAL